MVDNNVQNDNDDSKTDKAVTSSLTDSNYDKSQADADKPSKNVNDSVKNNESSASNNNLKPSNNSDNDSDDKKNDEEEKEPDFVSSSLLHLTIEQQLAKAEQVARRVHAGQKDLGGNDYIEHCKYVADHLKTPLEKTVGWLHDTLEDTDYTTDDMVNDGFSPVVINCVILLTHRKGEPYLDYINNLKFDETARHVKMADIANNLDLKRLNSFDKVNSPESKRRVQKYLKAMEILVKAEGKSMFKISSTGKPVFEDKKEAGDENGSNNENGKPKSFLKRIMYRFKHNPIASTIVVIVLALVVCMSYASFNASPHAVTTEQGFAIMKDNKMVNKATIYDMAQQADVILNKNYYYKDDYGNTINAGRKISFSWTIGQRERLAKILNKSKFKNGYTAVGIRNNMWSNLISSIIPTLLFLGLMYWFFKNSNKLMGNSMSLSNNISATSEDVQKITFDDVKGVDTAVVELKEICSMITNREKYDKVGASMPKGIILFGPPGTGKTLMAKALSNEADANFYYASASSFVEMFVGLGAKRVRDLFEKAEEDTHKKGMKPRSIIFLDELDAVGGARSSMDGNSERAQTLNQLLVSMDGFNANSNVFVIAATNRIDTLDRALLRPGRFDRQIGVDLPDKKGRLEILQVHAKNKLINNSHDLAWVADQTQGFSGADLANVLNESASVAVRGGHDKIMLSDLSEAIDRVMMGPKKLNREDYKKSIERTAYHEAGHAIAAMATSDDDAVTKITILPRANALGYTSINSIDDKTNYTESQLYSKLCSLMGGLVAEELIFGDVSTGPSSDIRKANSIARDMVTKYGFGHNTTSQLRFLNVEDMSNNDGGTPMSQNTLSEIDKEVHWIIDTAYNRAVNVINANMNLFKELVQSLMEKETLTSEDLSYYKNNIIKL